MLLISNFDSFFPDPWRKEEQKVTDELQNNCIYNLKSLFFFFFLSLGKIKKVVLDLTLQLHI